MGRRSVATTDPKRLRDAVGRHFRRLTTESGVNLAEFTAQRFEEECIILVRDMAFSMEASMDHRLKCAQQIVEWARGKVVPWHHTGETIDPTATTPLGGTVGETIDAVRATTELFAELDRLVRNKIPYRDWPSEIQNLAEAAAFADLDDDNAEALPMPASGDGGDPTWKS